MLGYVCWVGLFGGYVVMEWGPNIYTGQKRPRWLTDDDTPLYWHDAGWQGGRSTAGQLEWVQTGDPLEYIQLPADHFANLAIARGFTPWAINGEEPKDWDGEETLLRGGQTRTGKVFWDTTPHPECHVIGYHTKPIAQPSPVDTVTVSVAPKSEAEWNSLYWTAVGSPQCKDYMPKAVRKMLDDAGLIRPATKAERIAKSTSLPLADVERVLTAIDEGE